MMVVALYLIALAMVVGGAAAAAQGYVYVMVEFGWSTLIAGSVVATGGAVLFGLAHVAARLKRLEAAANRAADRAGRGGVIFPEQPDTLARLAGPAVPNMTATAGAGLTGLGVSAVAAAAAASSTEAASEPKVATDRQPEMDRETKFEPVAESEPPSDEEPGERSPFGVVPAKEPEAAPAAEERAEEPEPEPEPEVPEIASVPIVTREDLDETVEAESPPEIAITSKDRFSMEEAALVEVDDLPKAPAPEARPFPPQTEPVDRLPPRPEPVEEEPAALSAAEEEPPSRGFRLRDIFASRSSREERNPPPIPAPPPLPPFSMRVDPPLPVPPPPPEPEAPEPDIERPRDMDEVAGETTPDDDASEEPVVVGTYMSGGNQYVMYSDGSIEAETPTGRYRFKSLEELKGFIETGAETPVT